MARDNIDAAYIAHALGGGKEFQNGPDSWNTVCPAHNDDGPSLTVTDGRDNRLVVHCHAKCSQSAVIDALKRLDLWPKQYKPKNWEPRPFAPETAPKISALNHPRLGPASATWEYRDVKGRIVGYSGRFDKPDGSKELSFMTWCRDADNGKESWAWKSFVKPRTLYGAQFLGDDPKQEILIVEGEKTADAARKLFVEEGYLVMTWPGGSKAVKYANWELLKGRQVVIWPDNDEPGFKAAQQIAEILLAAEAENVRIVDVPKTLPKGWDLADKTPPDMVIDVFSLARMAPQYQAESGDVIQRYNKEFALVLVGDKATVLWEKPMEDKPGVVDVKFINPTAFSQLFGNDYVSLGRKNEAAPKYWMTHERRRTYHGVVFEPARTTKRDYNLWRGFAVEPDPDGDWSLFEEHLRENVAQGDESLFRWIVAWFAQLVQQPRNKPGTSLALRGLQGTGKTVVGQHMGALFPQHYTLVDDPRYVIGNFNAHMAALLLLHADEAFFAGDPRHSGRLKGMVTSTTNRIEPKGKDSFEVANYMRLFISSNSHWMVPAGFEERRFAVVDVGEGKMQDRAYFKAMEQQMLNGGYEGLLHHLQHLDLSTVDVGVIPGTAALSDQKVLSLESVHRFWYECLRDGEILPGKCLGWPDAVSSEDLYQAYLDRAIKWGDRRRVGNIQFGRDLNLVVPGGDLIRKKITHKRVDQGGFTHNERVWGYVLPPLEMCREAFDKTLRMKNDWPSVDEPAVEEAKKDAIPF